MEIERPADDSTLSVEEGVPVTLPVRDGSPGGSYGTAAEGHMLHPAVFPLGVRLRDRAADRWVSREASRSSRPTLGRKAIVCGDKLEIQREELVAESG